MFYKTPVVVIQSSRLGTIESQVSYIFDPWPEDTYDTHLKNGLSDYDRDNLERKLEIDGRMPNFGCLVISSKVHPTVGFDTINITNYAQ